MSATWLRHPAETLQAMRRAPGRTWLATTTLASALLLMGAYAMLLHDLARAAGAWQRGSFVTCSLAAAEPRGWEDTRARLAALPGVAEASLTPPAEALARFAARGPEAAALVAGADAEALPASVELTLDGQADVAAIVAAAHAVAGVDAVDDGGDEQHFVRALLRVGTAGGLGLGLLIGLTAACMVANTVRLAVYQARDQVAILELVGATRRFIAAPFVLQGIAWGLLGGGLASAVLWACDRMVAQPLTAALAPLTGGAAMRLIEAAMPLWLMGGGALLSAAVSAAAVRRCLARGL